MKARSSKSDDGLTASPANSHTPANQGIPIHIRIPVLVAIVCVSPTLTFGDVVNPAAWDDLEAGRNDVLVLSAGDQAQVIDDQGTVRIQQQTLSPAEMQRRLQWRKGRLVFTGQPLAEVVAEFERYNTDQLVIADETIADLKIDGSFAARDLKAFLSFLQTQHGITATTRNPGAKQPEIITLVGPSQAKIHSRISSEK
jgi:hypothetical protein